MVMVMMVMVVHVHGLRRFKFETPARAQGGLAELGRTSMLVTYGAYDVRHMRTSALACGEQRGSMTMRLRGGVESASAQCMHETSQDVSGAEDAAGSGLLAL
jgi:hypothetical protein